MAVISTDINLTAVSRTAGEILEITNNATLTVDSSTVPNTGGGRILGQGKFLITNASTTTPIVWTFNANTNDFQVEQNGIIEVRGAPISLGTATGLASETFSLFSAPLDVIPYPSLVEVETSAGSGEYWPYFIVCTAGKTVLWATTEFCAVGASGRVLFWNDTTRVLTSGDGTNGSLLPAGANVRIPNIYIHSATTNNTPNLRSQIDLNPSGTIDAEWCGFSDHIYFNVSAFKKALFTHCGFAGEVRTISSNSEVIYDHVSINPDTTQSSTGQLYRCTNINGPVTINKLVALMGGLVTQNNPCQIANNFQMQKLDNCVFARRDGRDATTDEAFLLQSINPDFIVNNLSVIGSRFEGVNLIGTIFNGFYHADSLGTAQITTLGINAITGTNIANCKWLGFFNAGIASCRDYIYDSDAQSVGNEIYGMNYNGGNNTPGICESDDTDFKATNCTITNIRGDLTFYDSPGTFINNRHTLKNVRGTLGSGTFLRNEASQNTELNFLVGTPRDMMFTLPSTVISFSSAGGYTFGNFIDLGLTPATGNLMAGPFSDNTSATVSGGAYYNQAGWVHLPEINSAIEVESLFPVVGITSFVNTAPTWNYVDTVGTSLNTATAPPDVTAEFRVRTPSGTYGAYLPLTGSDLSTAIAGLTGYDSDAGLYFQLKLTATVADTLRRINKVYFGTNVDSGYTAPDGTIELLGPAIDDETTMYLDADDSTIAVFTGYGPKSFSGGATYFQQDIYFIRRTAGGVTIISTKSTPITMTIGDNGSVSLFTGNEIQLAESQDVTAIKAKIDLYLDATISSRLASAGYTAPGDEVTSGKIKNFTNLIPATL